MIRKNGFQVKRQPDNIVQPGYKCYLRMVVKYGAADNIVQPEYRCYLRIVVNSADNII